MTGRAASEPGDEHDEARLQQRWRAAGEARVREERMLEPAARRRLWVTAAVLIVVGLALFIVPLPGKPIAELRELFERESVLGR